MRPISVHYLTLIEPFASLISLPADDPRAKRVENRSWTLTGRLLPTIERPLTVLIHAGAGRKYQGRPVEDWAHHFGIAPDTLRPRFAIAMARVVSILPVNEVRALPDDHPLAWAKDHMHTSGPFCWILGDVCPIDAGAVIDVNERGEMRGLPGLQKTEVDADRLPAKAQRWLGLRPGPKLRAAPLRTDIAPPAVGGLFANSFLGLVVPAFH